MTSSTNYFTYHPYPILNTIQTNKTEAKTKAKLYRTNRQIQHQLFQILVLHHHVCITAADSSKNFNLAQKTNLSNNILKLRSSDSFFKRLRANDSEKRKKKKGRLRAKNGFCGIRVGECDEPCRAKRIPRPRPLRLR